MAWKPHNHPPEGYRGFILAKWGFWLAFYITTLAFIALFIGALDGGILPGILLTAGALGGAGSVGQAGANIAERWKPQQIPPPPPDGDYECPDP